MTDERIDAELVRDGIESLGYDALTWREEQYGGDDPRCNWRDENDAIAAFDRISARLEAAESLLAVLDAVRALCDDPGNGEKMNALCVALEGIDGRSDE